LYTLVTREHEASFIVISTLALRGKVDKKAGVLFVTVYLLSYVLLVYG